MRKSIAVSNPSFAELRSDENCLYVDKTKYIYSLVNDRINYYYFISRPRRYGKSLMCSTFKALFEGKRELFKGLYIDGTDYSFEKYPVLHFNFADISTATYEIFLKAFQRRIIDAAHNNGVEIEREEPSEMLYSLLYKFDRKVVIIVDEYDTPIIHTYTNIELADRIRESLSAFYTVIKNTNEKVRFFFITGITRFSNMSIFSQMNNLIDLTFNPDFAAAFGYTEEELETNFSPYIDDYMARLDREYETREGFLSAVRTYYDGYRFSQDSPLRVYNPVSIGFFFNQRCGFKPYWMDTGASTLAVDLARDYHLGRIVTEDYILGTDTISSFDYRNLATHSLDDSQVIALLFFTGYLTIKDGDAFALTLTFPNMEVRTAFTKSLIRQYAGGADISNDITMARSALNDRDIPALVRAMNAFYEKIPSSVLSKEIGYQGMFYAFFLLFGVESITAEEATTLGRIDVTITLPGDVYVIEIKVNHSVKKALEQIRNKRYYAKYINTDKRIHIVGLNFTSRSRKISSYREEIIDKTKEPTFLG